MRETARLRSQARGSRRGHWFCGSAPAARPALRPHVGFALVLIGYSQSFAAIRAAAGKRTVAGLVAHGWGNAFVPLFPRIVMAEGAAQQRYWIWAGLTLLRHVILRTTWTVGISSLTDLLKSGSAAARPAQGAGVLGQRAFGFDDPVLARALPLIRLAPSEGVLAFVAHMARGAASRADHRTFSILGALSAGCIRTTAAAHTVTSAYSRQPNTKRRISGLTDRSRKASVSKPPSFHETQSGSGGCADLLNSDHRLRRLVRLT